MEKSFEAHLTRIQGHLATGRDVLRSLHGDNLTTYDMPDVVPDRTVVTQSHPPLDTDKYVSLPFSLPFASNNAEY